MANSSLAVRQLYEPERSLAFGGISGAYAVVGTPTAHAAHEVLWQNQTDAPITFSWDGTTAAFTLDAHTSFVSDVQSNRSDIGRINLLAAGTQFWVKQVSAPTLGSVYISVFYGANFNNL